MRSGVIMPRPPGFLDQLMNRDADGDADETSAQAKQQAAVLSALPPDARRALRYAQLLDRARSGEAIYLLPFDLKIR